MTALEKRIRETPMAPYIGLMNGMTKEERQIVVAYLVELQNETDDRVKELRRRLNVPESEATKMFREHVAPQEWNPIEAWNRLTDAQREEAATKLRLTPEDMDERTFYIIKKHLR